MRECVPEKMTGSVVVRTRTFTLSYSPILSVRVIANPIGSDWEHRGENGERKTIEIMLAALPTAAIVQQVQMSRLRSPNFNVLSRGTR